MTRKSGDLAPTTYSFSYLAELLSERKSLTGKMSSKSSRKISSGFKAIDERMDGWNPGDFIFIGSRPAMGKTALVLSMALEMNLQDATPIAVFSLEMTAENLFSRIISIDAEISRSDLENNLLSLEKRHDLEKSIARLSRSNIIIDDEKFSVFEDLQESATYYKERFGTEVFILDYFQLIAPISLDRESVNRLLKNIKKMAIDLNCVVIVTSQLPRSLEKRKNKKPKLSDIYEWGDFEKHVDVIGFVYRPEYYGIMQSKKGSSNQAKALFIVDKFYKNCKITFPFRFIGEFAKFKEWEEND